MVDDGELRKNVDILNKAFEAETSEAGSEAASAGGGSPASLRARAPLLPRHLFQSLPLWRVQWVTLPAFNELLNVHVPHYTHMFTKLLSKPRPWYFGSFYLEGGSQNLGSEDHPLREGEVGTLCEVVAFERQQDGRLLLSTRAVGRVVVTSVVQRLPYAQADCEYFADFEEMEAFDEAGMEAAVDLAPSSAALDEMSDVVACSTLAAAAAHGCGWAERERVFPPIGGEVSPLSVIEAADDAEIEHMASSIAHTVVAAANGAARHVLTKGAPAEGDESSPPAVTEAANDAAFIAMQDEEQDEGEEELWELNWRDWQENELEMPLAQVERCLWNELLSTWALAGKLKDTAQATASMPEQIVALMPPAPKDGWEECPTQANGSPLLPQATLPGLVRRSRSSFLLTALLPDVVKNAEQRLELLQTKSVRSRLLLLVEELEKQRKVLAAVVALRGAVSADGDSSGGGSQPDGGSDDAPPPANPSNGPGGSDGGETPS